MISEEISRQRIEQSVELFQRQAPDNFGKRLQYRCLRVDADQGIYYLAAHTEPWMCNIEGFVHGGICASLVDQAMGLVAYCLKDGEDIAPTVELQISYHRPLPPGEEILIKIRSISVTRRLIHLAAEACNMENPDHVYFSSTATFFCRVKA